MRGVLNFIVVTNTRRYFYRVIAIDSPIVAPGVSHDRRTLRPIMIPTYKQHLGTAIIILGVATGIIGSTVNDLGLHLPAIQVWTLISNPCLFIWAIGSCEKWWNSSLSYKALAVLYVAYEIGGIFALVYLK